MISKELEAFLEFITVTRSLGQKTIEAYTSDLLHIEEAVAAPLITLDLEKILSYLGRYDNKRTRNRKLSSINAFFDFCYKNRY
ncbi:MAG: site-specific integrase, partial [Thiovulaceae bacterium]|nr:site-specific integrase [Sulfurimonadaceae bacterium]